MAQLRQQRVVINRVDSAETQTFSINVTPNVPPSQITSMSPTTGALGHVGCSGCKGADDDRTPKDQLEGLWADRFSSLFGSAFGMTDRCCWRPSMVSLKPFRSVQKVPSPAYKRCSFMSSGRPVAKTHWL